MRALRRTPFAWAASLLALAALAGCGPTRALLAGNDDLADYRAFRVAAHEGVRLARAERYLAAHPRGAWSDEVRHVFEEEEPAYFERASASRKATSEYLADLPHGPHAEAAVALLTAYDTRLEDIETARLMREARHSEATLERASVQRRRLGEAILADVAALLDPAVYGADTASLPPALTRALRGESPATWGGQPRLTRASDFFYSLPTSAGWSATQPASHADERASSFATVELVVATDGGVVTRGRVEGGDLFVRWEEADSMTLRDPTSETARAAAASHATELLAGAMEAALPAARCARPPPGRELLVRECDGVRAIVTMGAGPGDRDVISISGPAGRSATKATP